MPVGNPREKGWNLIFNTSWVPLQSTTWPRGGRKSIRQRYQWPLAASFAAAARAVLSSAPRRRSASRAPLSRRLTAAPLVVFAVARLCNRRRERGHAGHRGSRRAAAETPVRGIQRRVPPHIAPASFRKRRRRFSNPLPTRHRMIRSDFLFKKTPTTILAIRCIAPGRKPSSLPLKIRCKNGTTP